MVTRRPQMSCAIVLAGMFWAVLLSGNPLAHAGKKQKSRQGNRSNQQVAAARSRLASTEKSLAAVRQSIIRARQKHKAAVVNRSKTIAELSGKKESDRGLAKAQHKLDSIKEELDQVRTVVLGKIQIRSDYQDAVVAADEAHQQLEAYRAEHPDDTAAIRTQAKEVARLASIPRQMESDALNQDPSYQEIRKRYLEAGKQLRSIRDRLEKSFKNDRRFQAAVQKVRQADAELARAESKLKAEGQKTLAAQIALARAIQQSQQQRVSEQSKHRKSHKRRNGRGRKRKR